MDHPGEKANQDRIYRQENEEQCKQRSRDYYQANKEKMNAANNAWRLNNLETEAAANKAWRENNRERFNANQRRAYESNIEARKKQAREWKAALKITDIEKWRLLNRRIGARRRARKVAAGGNHTVKDILSLFSSQSGLCNACKCELVKYQVDHIHPLSKGGSNGKENLQLLCPSCNTSKHALSMDEFMQRRRLRSERPQKDLKSNIG